MSSKAELPEDYMDALPEDRKEAMTKLREALLINLPKGFREEMSYGMLGYVVPHALYPKGYHCNPKLPLPFINLASQKNSINFYHMGIYADTKLLKWFIDEYAKTGLGKLDMGKSCMRFKKMTDIPFDFIGELATKMSVEDWIGCYENAFKH